MNFVKSHLKKFLEVKDKFQAWSGMSAKTLAKGTVMDPEILQRLPEQRHNRNELLEFCQNGNNDGCVASLAVFAWGGMKKQKNNFPSAWKTREKWIPLANQLRGDKSLTRESAYELFFDQKSQIRGLGPAYYTKLIFFLARKRDGYILDQWTARSINLLCGDNIVKLTKSGNSYQVSKDNQPSAYKSYCEAVEALAEMTGEDPSRVEEQLMSCGRGKGLWRKYVIKVHNESQDKI